MPPLRLQPQRCSQAAGRMQPWRAMARRHCLNVWKSSHRFFYRLRKFMYWNWNSRLGLNRWCCCNRSVLSYRSSMYSRLCINRNKLLTYYSTGSQRPHRCCTLTNKVEHIDREQVWTCISITFLEKSPFSWGIRIQLNTRLSHVHIARSISISSAVSAGLTLVTNRDTYSGHLEKAPRPTPHPRRT